MFWIRNKHGNQLADLYFRLNLGNTLFFRWKSGRAVTLTQTSGEFFFFLSFWWCSLKFIHFQSDLNTVELQISSLSVLLLWHLVCFSNLCSAFLLSLFTSLVSCCCGLRVRVFVWAGHPLPYPPSFSPLCTFCHCLSPPSLPLQRSPVWEPLSVHSGNRMARKHTHTQRHTQSNTLQIRRPFINTWDTPLNTVV